ncbi:energy transducer TonB [Acidiphilium acidophilum]|uniref:energy transducer TonB n=1 Tax=Acidiphilium acidophilum TaxID=76588 RepID=UPI002E8E71C7|nr:energy transducer TonB [Acidiphilium acidophilum]
MKLSSISPRQVGCPDPDYERRDSRCLAPTAKTPECDRMNRITPSIAALGLALLAASPGIASAQSAPTQSAQAHPLSPKTRATLAQDAKRLLATPGVQRVGFYGFIVDRAGHVLSEWVVRSSGSASLDHMALATIGKAMLKRLPAHSPPTMQFIIPIAFHKNGTTSTGAPAAPPS